MKTKIHRVYKVQNFFFPTSTNLPALMERTRPGKSSGMSSRSSAGFGWDSVGSLVTTLNLRSSANYQTIGTITQRAPVAPTANGATKLFVRQISPSMRVNSGIFEGVDAMEIGYGRRTGRMADEWQRSSTLINCLERSSFSNKLWLYDKEKGNPLAAWIKWKTGKHTFDTAIFSGTYDDYVGELERQQSLLRLVAWQFLRGPVLTNCMSIGYPITSRMGRSIKTGWLEETTGQYHL